MKRAYQVAYAGMPGSLCQMEAASEREAAMLFFAKNPLQNSIIVRSGWLRENVFSWRDFSTEVPILDEVSLPLETEDPPPYDPARDPFVTAYRGLFCLLSVLSLGGSFWFIFEEETPWIASLALAAAGCAFLAIALFAPARALRREMTRGPF